MEIAVEKIFKGGIPDEKRVEELVGKLEGKLDGYEAILAKQKYVGGDVRASLFEACPVKLSILMDLVCLQNLTAADLFHLPYGTIIFEELGYGNLDKRPNVKRWVLFRVWPLRLLIHQRRWWNDISSRPAWQAVKNGT